MYFYIVEWCLNFSSFSIFVEHPNISSYCQVHMFCLFLFVYFCALFEGELRVLVRVDMSCSSLCPHLEYIFFIYLFIS